MNAAPQLARGDSKRLGELIRRAREAKKWNQADLAEAIGQEMEIPDVPINWVSHLESGPPRPLADPVRFAGALWALGLTWKDGLTALGLWDGSDRVSRVFESE